MRSRVTPRFVLTWVTGYMMVVPFLEMERIGLGVIGVQQVFLVLSSFLFLVECELMTSSGQ